MQILELPSIPKERKQLQALINEARHAARIRKWAWRGVYVVLFAMLFMMITQCGAGASAGAPAAELLYLPLIISE
jgi:hypothetical protein